MPRHTDPAEDARVAALVAAGASLGAVAADLGRPKSWVQRAVDRHRAAQGAPPPPQAAAAADPLPAGPLDPILVQEQAIRELCRAMAMETNAARLGTLTSQLTMSVQRLEAMREKRAPGADKGFRLAFYVPQRSV